MWTRCLSLQRCSLRRCQRWLRRCQRQSPRCRTQLVRPCTCRPVRKGAARAPLRRGPSALRGRRSARAHLRAAGAAVGRDARTSNWRAGLPTAVDEGSAMCNPGASVTVLRARGQGERGAERGETAKRTAERAVFFHRHARCLRMPSVRQRSARSRLRHPLASAVPCPELLEIVPDTHRLPVSRPVRLSRIPTSRLGERRRADFGKRTICFVDSFASLALGPSFPKEDRLTGHYGTREVSMFFE